MLLPLPLIAAAGHGPEAVGTVLMTLAVVLAAAKLAGEIVERVGQPAVLGELTVGIVLGNLSLLGGPDLADVAHAEAFTVLAELGAVLLLFQVGLESTPREMLAVGGRATLVAMVGVVTPMALGFGVGRLFRPEESWMLHAFLGPMLAATSVGITARVLKDAGVLRGPVRPHHPGRGGHRRRPGPARAGGGVRDHQRRGLRRGPWARADRLLIVGKAVAFLVGALVVGSLLSPRLFKQRAGPALHAVWCRRSR